MPVEPLLADDPSLRAQRILFARQIVGVISPEGSYGGLHRRVPVAPINDLAAETNPVVSGHRRKAAAVMFWSRRLTADVLSRRRSAETSTIRPVIFPQPHPVVARERGKDLSSRGCPKVVRRTSRSSRLNRAPYHLQHQRLHGDFEWACTIWHTHRELRGHLRIATKLVEEAWIPFTRFDDVGWPANAVLRPIHNAA